MKHLPCVKHCTRYFTFTNPSNQLMEKGLLNPFFFKKKKLRLREVEIHLVPMA